MSISESTQEHNNATWSLLRRADSLGFGYIAQDSQFDTEAVREGWEVMFTGMPAPLAIQFRDIYKRAGVPQLELTSTPDLSDLLTYDFTDVQENRIAEFAEEFDLVRVPYAGMWIEGTITAITEDYIELDGFWMIDIEDALQGELIAKADSDSGFITEYGKYLDELEQNWERTYAIAVSEQNRLELDEVA
jgi:hypothetical protein